MIGLSDREAEIECRGLKRAYPKLPDEVITYIVKGFGDWSRFLDHLHDSKTIRRPRNYKQLFDLGHGGKVGNAWELACHLAKELHKPVELLFPENEFFFGDKAFLKGAEPITEEALKRDFPRLPERVVDLIVEKGSFLNFFNFLIEQRLFSTIHLRQAGRSVISIGRQGRVVSSITGAPLPLASALATHFRESVEAIFPRDKFLYYRPTKARKHGDPSTAADKNEVDPVKRELTKRKKRTAAKEGSVTSSAQRVDLEGAFSELAGLIEKHNFTDIIGLLPKSLRMDVTPEELRDTLKGELPYMFPHGRYPSGTRAFHHLVNIDRSEHNPARRTLTIEDTINLLRRFSNMRQPGLTG